MSKVGLLWRAEWNPPQPGPTAIESYRLHGVFAAFAALGVAAQPVIYTDERADEVREQLLALDGVLVWVNPIEQGLNRYKLDPLLREVAEAGVWVSAHPDVILKMATKRVLFDTREMSWGSDTRLYLSADELRDGLAVGLADGSPRVLKQQRGMGGQGVWKVELDMPAGDPWLRIEHATRGAARERLQLGEFVARCESYFGNDGLMIEQPFQERIGEGMIRCYMTHAEVVGFAHQYPAGLRPESAEEPPPGKRFEAATAPAFARLRQLVESKWAPELQLLLDIDMHALPVIWDIDFLYGPKLESGEDTYVLCEINASSTFAFPEHAMPTVAQAALQEIRATTPR